MSHSFSLCDRTGGIVKKDGLISAAGFPCHLSVGAPLGRKGDSVTATAALSTSGRYWSRGGARGAGDLGVDPRAPEGTRDYISRVD
jgi:hypothetical protein